MNNHTGEQWLKLYYFTRAAFSILWVFTALSVGQHDMKIAGVLLVLYPAWDAFSNYRDAVRSGGLLSNRSQMINVLASLATTVAVAVALPGMNLVVGIFGAWAILSGLLQLGTALRRWKQYGAQWAMALSGAQSALAGGFFIYQAQSATPPGIVNLAGYAGFGAFYFLVSALWLALRPRRQPA
jgi:uncharacterized membrane protein HdeD (DUF308 family)